ncbi:hybrid sensor histidine kinase/response regulator transcription factor [Mucilaginibacter pocheonensis]|uniref:histidine kinase n=1 Tax=Mucilaginibacter pocheonensis TaxID=398050 RepID=A0ABU1T8K8_9SPHI|nr:two-component regulator propeller domain-containing protein [Mucilaginibacter pocheonensis]MDR6941638.1 ligand-binding sensor domain-containing protein/signal transduction histidine kinase/CheY-like chemotaxis protein/AraC-like DNA-binding protein [Mucilaginibacter pocheonensis]
MKRFCLLILLQLAIFLSYGQAPIKNKVLKYSLKDGLSFGIVNSITQDENGFMWFATNDGLNRFDGSSFKVFKTRQGDTTALSSNYVQKIFSDHAGYIWVSSRDGLSKLNTRTEKFYHYKLTANHSIKNDVNNIIQSKNKNFWISSYGLGFSYFKIKSAEVISYNRVKLPQLSSDRIVSMLEDSQGLLWLGTQDAGVNIFHQKNGIVTDKINTSSQLASFPQGRVNEIFEDHFHNIWIATSNGLIHYNRALNKFSHFQTRQINIKSNRFISLIEDDDKNLLVGLQDGGLYKLPLNTFTDADLTNFNLTPVTGDDGYNITQRSVQTLYVDRDQNIWIGTYGEGIYMISSIREKFTRIIKNRYDAVGKGLIRFYGMCQDKNGLLWFGTDGDGIFKTLPDGSLAKHYYADGKPGSLTDNAILCGYVDRDNNIWFGTYAKGLFRYDKKTDSFVNYGHNTDNIKTIGGNDVRVIYQDTRKNLWIGSNGGGLSLFEPSTNTFTNYNPGNSGLSSYDVRAITEDTKGNLLIGTYGGGIDYLEVQNKKFKRFFNPADEKKYIQSEVIFSLYLDNTNRLWIGTEGDGLIIYNLNNHTFKFFNEKNKLANNTVYAIKNAENSSVWLSTNKGLSNIDLRNNRVMNFDQSDGLQAGQFNVGSVLYDTQNKQMYFGGTEGLNVFDPENVNKSYFKPQVVITGLQIFGRQVEVGESGSVLSRAINETKQLVLQPDQSVFSIQYTSLNYAYPQKGAFAYELEGLDKTWNFVGNQGSATYRYLEPGNYTFRVKCSNQDGIWFNDYATLQIKILPPWYKTWWAYLCYIVAGGLVVYYYLLYRTNQARLKYEIKITQLSAEKDKELNEKKLSFFTNISHEFRTPLTLIINPIKELLYHEHEVDTSNLNIVYRNAKRLLSLVDQLLLFRKADSESGKLTIFRLNIVELSKEVFLCFTYQAKAKGLTFEFICAEQHIEIFADREKIEIVLFNLLSNAIKFTPAGGSVKMVITEQAADVKIEVVDTGYGIKEGTGDNLYSQFYQQEHIKSPSIGGFGIGLFLVKKFIEDHSGKISFESTVGVGTSFSVTLLKGKAHLKTDIVFEDEETSSVILQELVENEIPVENTETEDANLFSEELEIAGDLKSILIIDDNKDLREYLKMIFRPDYKIYSTDNGQDGLLIIKETLPDIVISDVMMDKMSGIELCAAIREDISISHIPVILLTSSSSPEIKLKGIEGGADDYISKPFDKEILKARVAGILRNKNNLQKYFYNEITLNSTNQKIPAEYKNFLDNCIRIVEKHIMNPDFNIQILAGELGISHSTLYKKIKFISGQSANGFIRFIRLRKAAEILINTRHNIFETTYLVGINDIKYFREQFKKLFGLNPSQYVKKYRKNFSEDLVVNEFTNKPKGLSETPT